MRQVVRGSILLPLALVVPACTDVPDYHPAGSAALKVPGRYNGTPAPAGPAIDLETWWTGFHDPVLSSLIATSLSANNDIASLPFFLLVARSLITWMRQSVLHCLARPNAHAARAFR